MKRLINYYIWKATGSVKTEDYEKWWTTPQPQFENKKPCDLPIEEIWKGIHTVTLKLENQNNV